jgi:hypothetical protein
MNRFTRRLFIATSVAVLAAFSRRSLHVFGNLPADWELAVDLVRIFEEHQSSAQAVGREHLRHTPTEASVTRLVSLICAEQSERPPIGRSRRAVREWACAKISDDFRSGRVVEIQGWILSATEARLCALAAIS